ncbi:MAG: hypothetical protein KGJ13_10660 [Patescibacteria group bacterium]|nr:hypothetical protein [Patescibacteria group bacterium]
MEKKAALEDPYQRARTFVEEFTAGKNAKEITDELISALEKAVGEMKKAAEDIATLSGEMGNKNALVDTQLAELRARIEAETDAGKKSQLANQLIPTSLQRLDYLRELDTKQNRLLQDYRRAKREAVALETAAESILIKMKDTVLEAQLQQVLRGLSGNEGVTIH